MLHRLGRLAASPRSGRPARGRARRGRGEEVPDRPRRGFYNTQDEVRSPAANTLVLIDPNDEPVAVFIDPGTTTPPSETSPSSPVSQHPVGVLRVQSLLRPGGRPSATRGSTWGHRGPGLVQRRPLDENEEYHFDVFPVAAGLDPDPDPAHRAGAVPPQGQPQSLPGRRGRVHGGRLRLQRRAGPALDRMDARWGALASLTNNPQRGR